MNYSKVTDLLTKLLYRLGRRDITNVLKPNSPGLIKSINRVLFKFPTFGLEQVKKSVAVTILTENVKEIAKSKVPDSLSNYDEFMKMLDRVVSRLNLLSFQNKQPLDEIMTFHLRSIPMVYTRELDDYDALEILVKYNQLDNTIENMIDNILNLYDYFNKSIKGTFNFLDRLYAFSPVMHDGLLISMASKVEPDIYVNYIMNLKNISLNEDIINANKDILLLFNLMRYEKVQELVMSGGIDSRDKFLEVSEYYRSIRTKFGL